MPPAGGSGGLLCVWRLGRSSKRMVESGHRGAQKIMIPKVITTTIVIFKQCAHIMLNVFLGLSY